MAVPLYLTRNRHSGSRDFKQPEKTCIYFPVLHTAPLSDPGFKWIKKNDFGNSFSHSEDFIISRNLRYLKSSSDTWVVFLSNLESILMEGSHGFVLQWLTKSMVINPSEGEHRDRSENVSIVVWDKSKGRSLWWDPMWCAIEY